ncbi:hypothetical protein, partial [Ectobacillus funiculus]
SFLDYGLCGNYHYTRIWGGTPFLCSKNPWHARAEDYEIDSTNWDSKKIQTKNNREAIPPALHSYQFVSGTPTIFVFYCNRYSQPSIQRALFAHKKDILSLPIF